MVVFFDGLVFRRTLVPSVQCEFFQYALTVFANKNFTTRNECCGFSYAVNNAVPCLPYHKFSVPAYAGYEAWSWRVNNDIANFFISCQAFKSLIVFFISLQNALRTPIIKKVIELLIFRFFCRSPHSIRNHFAYLCFSTYKFRIAFQKLIKLKMPFFKFFSNFYAFLFYHRYSNTAP